MGLPATFGQIEDVQRLHSGSQINVEQVDDHARFQKGTLAFSEDGTGAVFRYVQMRNHTTALAAKSAVGFATAGFWNVTGDESAQINNTAAGITMAAAATNQYVWIQVAGIIDGVRKETGAIAAGDILQVSDGTDGVVEDDDGNITNASDIRRIVGVALSAATSAASTIDNVLLRGLL